jgi:hypothetical protein
MTDFVYATCAPCGVVVVDAAAHALWHARVADLAPLLAALVTTLDPETGTPVVAVRPNGERADAAAFATLKTQADAALASNTTYLALATPTTVQAVAQVRALTQQANTLIRLAVRTLL